MNDKDKESIINLLKILDKRVTLLENRVVIMTKALSNITGSPIYGPMIHEGEECS